MRESLICIGKIGEKGYYFEDTGIQIFSYEELCYYMSQHMIAIFIHFQEKICWPIYGMNLI